MTCALGRVDVAVLQTGVGTQALFGAAEALGCKAELLAALERATVIARSPKPAAVLRRNKVRIDLMPPEPYTTEDMIESIAGMEFAGREVAVQAYGGPNNLLTRSLRERGANVREVALYRWGLPDDVSPVLELIRRLDQRARSMPLRSPASRRFPTCLTIARQSNPDLNAEDTLRRCLGVGIGSRGLGRPGLHPPPAGKRAAGGCGAGASAHGQLGNGAGRAFPGA